MKSLLTAPCILVLSIAIPAASTLNPIPCCLIGVVGFLAFCGVVAMGERT